MCLSTQPHLSRQAERELGDVLTAADHLVTSWGLLLYLRFCFCCLPFPSPLSSGHGHLMHTRLGRPWPRHLSAPAPAVLPALRLLDRRLRTISATQRCPSACWPALFFLFLFLVMIKKLPPRHLARLPPSFSSSQDREGHLLTFHVDFDVGCGS